MKKKFCSTVMFVCVLVLMLYSPPTVFCQILIDPNFFNPSSKANFDLIFADEFNDTTLNLQNWDVSTSDPQDDVECGFYFYDFMLSQVSVSGGNCVLKTEKATIENSNCPFDEECERGISGEIKTVTWRQNVCSEPDFPGVCFQNYEFPVGSYIEIRAKTTDADCNAGSSFWLYGGDQEIDVFETSGDEDDFISGYFSGRYLNGKYYGPYEKYETYLEKLWNDVFNLEGKSPKLVSVGFTMNRKVTIETTKLIWDLNTQKWVEQTTTSIAAGEHIDPSDYFITYGVQFNKDKIDFFLNNQLFFTYNLEDVKFNDGNLIDMRPKTIRLSTGQLTGGGNTPCTVPCSSQMEVDYVRVFYPSKKQAINWLDQDTVICESEERIIKASYLPGVVYSWSSSAFHIQKEWNGSPDSYVRIKFIKGLQTEKVYTITLNSIFPDGHTESLTRQYYVSGLESVTPPSTINIDYENQFCIATIPPSPSGCNCEKPNIYEWSLDNGITWHNYGLAYAFLNTNKKKLCVRTKNCNGVSNMICTQIQECNPQKFKLNTVDFSSTYTLYPNPVHDYLNVSNLIETYESSEKIIEVAVLDSFGKVYIKSQDQSIQSMDVSSLHQGIYFLLVKSSTGKAKIYRFYKFN